MGELVTLLKGVNTLGDAFAALKGKTLFEQPLPSPPRFTILETRSDYFIGLWKGNNVEKEFFAKYDMKVVFSLADK
jgi:hypothetical protein